MVWWELSCTAMGYAGHVCNKVQNVDMVCAQATARSGAHATCHCSARACAEPGDAPRVRRRCARG